MFRRIAAAFALLALVAMGVAVPEVGGSSDASSARAGDQDAQAIVPARRLGTRAGAEVDGRPAPATHISSGLVRLLGLATAAHLETPLAFAAGIGAAPASATPAVALAPRTSRGPPARS